MPISVEGLAVKPSMFKGVFAICVATVAIHAPHAADRVETKGPCSPIVRDTQGNVEINISCPIQLTPVQLRELIESIRTPEGVSPSFVSKFRDLSAQLHTVSWVRRSGSPG